MQESILNSKQLEIIKSFNDVIELNTIIDLIKNKTHDNYHIKDIGNFLEIANLCYRAGQQIIEDDYYDIVLMYHTDVMGSESSNTIEPDYAFGDKVELPERMFSTKKTYMVSEVKSFIDKIIDVGLSLNIKEEDILIRVTPKLDGFAAYKKGDKLYSRGDGRIGSDISHVLKHGVKDLFGKDSGTSSGAGEIVIFKSVFKDKLASEYKNTRNVIGTVLRQGELDTTIKELIDNGGVVFYNFKALHKLDSVVSTGADIKERFNRIISEHFKANDWFDCDGFVIEAVNTEIQEAMGFNSKHKRYQLAFKVNSEFVNARVKNVIPQTSRNGRVTPVVLVEPIELSGVTVSRVTAHHYGFIKENKISYNSVIQLIRSGQVIPKIVGISKEGREPLIPTNCPSCGSELYWDESFLYCPNATNCVKQASNTILHFFKTIGNIYGFGPSTTDILVENNITKVSEVYKLTIDDFKKFGFGNKRSVNLFNALIESKKVALYKYKFLAAFGVHELGLSTAEKLLTNYTLDEVFKLHPFNISAIHGFGDKMAYSITVGLAHVFEEYTLLKEMGFNLIDYTPNNELILKGLTIVFTGTMTCNRKEMEASAKALGANVGSSVSSKTDYLVTGSNVGASKLNKAKALGVKIITESEYLDKVVLNEFKKSN